MNAAQIAAPVQHFRLFKVNYKNLREMQGNSNLFSCFLKIILK